MQNSAESATDHLAHPNRNRQPPGRPADRNQKIAAAARKIDSLEKLLRFLRITSWHYLLVGDGSCTGNWEYEAGFACMVVPQHNPAEFYTRHGAYDRGTNIVAEMMAYVLPLMQLSAIDKIRVRHVHIVTDCEYLPKAAANVQWQLKSNSELWTMIRSFKRRGLVLHWHWVPRDILDMNKFCHDLANSARKSVKGLAEETLKLHTFTTIEVNGIDEETPSEE